jgi:hypothetical protein
MSCRLTQNSRRSENGTEMNNKVSIKGDGGKIVVEVFDYENPLAQNPDDASWLKATLTCAIGSFSGAWETAFTTYDLMALHDRMEQVLRSAFGRASFQNTEGDLTLNVEFSKSGKVQIDGVAEPHGSVKAALHYIFASDPSAVAETVRELKQVIERFPVKQVQP